MNKIEACRVGKDVQIIVRHGDHAGHIALLDNKELLEFAKGLVGTIADILDIVEAKDE